jgi:large subunit ribosomal protein L6
MSRIGQKPISVPEQVTVSVDERTVHVEGPKGKLSWTHRPEVSVALDESGKVVRVARRNDERMSKALHGTTRALIANMVEGCLNGYERKLEIYGVGYGAQVQGHSLSVSVGFAQARVMPIPDGITVTVETPQARGDTDPAKFTVSGVDKQAVGEFASEVRRIRKPEPYKGKGIRYAGERIVRKVGKAFAGAGG